ncbi:N4-gp56 family major capsid protein [Cytobacillus praedii]|uniref:N4-gp56 family major capsid protein n=1 Tax=Cytobacillus praedii TaxID=1742358 RepID=UPI00070B4931|nr:N4-gp56 family major capsid protein [Cytobacillus praedii]
MAVQTTNTAGLSPTMQTYYDKKLLARLLPMLFHLKWAQKRPIPKNGGKTINFRQFTALPLATTALTEGVKPAGNALNMTQKTGTLAQYGDYIEMSDILDLTAIDPVLDETADLLGEQSAQTLDVIARDVLVAGTSVQYAAGRVSRATIAAGDNLTVDEVRKARRTLKRANVKPLDGGDYVAIIEPGTAYDLQSDPKWEEVSKYAGGKQIFDGEIGRLYGVRFVETSFAKKFAGAGAASVDVYATLVFGKDFYGMSDVESSGSVKNIIKPHGSAGTADPLNQIATSGWKAFFTVVRLEELACVRIEHTVSG